MSYEICPCCGTKKPVSPNVERDKLIKERYAEGMTLATISVLNRITEARMRQIIGCDNLRFEDKHKNIRLKEERDKRNQEILRLHKHGHSAIFIGKKFGISRARTYQIVRKMFRIEGRAAAGQQAKIGKEKVK